MTSGMRFTALTDSDHTCAFRQLIDENVSSHTSVGTCFPGVARRLFGTTRYSRVDSEWRTDAGGQERYALVIAFVDEDADVVELAKPLYENDLVSSWVWEREDREFAFNKVEAITPYEEADWVVPSWLAWFEKEPGMFEAFADTRRVLSTLLSDFASGKSMSVSSEIRRLAERVAEQQRDECVDVADWAKKLASDIAEATD